ncbi:MAG: hypothetical protein ACRDOK_25945 [Streptosporangiaceae bacterium]
MPIWPGVLRIPASCSRRRRARVVRLANRVELVLAGLRQVSVRAPLTGPLPVHLPHDFEATGLAQFGQQRAALVDSSRIAVACAS